jgi:hypothetical protein
VTGHHPCSVVFTIRLLGRPGVDDIRDLRAILKSLLRRHQLRCVDLCEERLPNEAIEFIEKVTDIFGEPTSIVIHNKSGDQDAT